MLRTWNKDHSILHEIAFNLYKTHWNTTGIARNTIADIVS